MVLDNSVDFRLQIITFCGVKRAVDSSLRPRPFEPVVIVINRNKDIRPVVGSLQGNCKLWFMRRCKTFFRRLFYERGDELLETMEPAAFGF